MTGITKEQGDKMIECLEALCDHFQAKTDRTIIKETKAEDLQEVCNEINPNECGIKGARIYKMVYRASTEKALLLLYKGKENWVPKSCIHSEYDESIEAGDQAFIIDYWIVNQKWGE